MLDIFGVEFVKDFWSTIGALVLICGVLLIKMVRDFLISSFSKMLKKLMNRLTFRESVGVMRYIEDKLVELRTQLSADRAYVQEFKNGEYFSAKNPIWRIFRTYEKCQDGIIYQSSTLKGEYVTAIFDIIEPVIIGTTRSKGVTIMDCSLCPLECKNRNTVIFNVDEMPHTASKQMLLSHTVKLSIQTGITISGNVVGIVALDFCDELSKTMVNDKEWLHNCCKLLNAYTAKIEYCLANPSKFKK